MKEKTTQTMLAVSPQPEFVSTLPSSYGARDLEVILHANTCMLRNSEQEGCSKEDRLDLSARGEVLRAQLAFVTGARMPNITGGLSSNDTELAEFLESLGCVADAELFQNSNNEVAAGIVGGGQR